MLRPGIRLVLASASPRRAELLRAAGFEFDVEASDVDETRHPGEHADAYVRRMAELKAARRARPGDAVLGADTIVVIGGLALGKPADAGEAARMLRRLAGRTHEVLTGVCLIGPDGSSARTTRVERTTVEFAAMSEREIAWYVSTGEPLDKAGAYAIQGLASRFVTRIEGSYGNVVGLPVALVYDLCKDAGILVS
jgi:septum formation protein